MKLGWDKFQLLSIRADKIGNGCQTCSTGLESVRNGSAVLVLVGKVLRHVGENQIRDKSAGDFEGHRCNILATMLGEHTLKTPM